MTLKFDGQWDTSFILHQALCIISKSLVNSNWSYSQRSIWVKIDDFFSPVTLKFAGWPLKIIWHLFCTMLSFVYSFKAIDEFKLELQSGDAQFGSKWAKFCPVWPWNLMKNNRTSSILHQALCIIWKPLVNSNSNYSPETLNFGQNRRFCNPVTLTFDRWPWINNRAPLISNIKICASFHPDMWIQTGVTVWKWTNGVLTFVTLTFHLWLWRFAWTSLSTMVIILWWRCQEHCQKGVTDGRTDRRTKRSLQLLSRSYKFVYNNV